jgi:signal transduction histidine kinase
MFQLIKSLLDVNAIESGNFALHPTNFDVRGILENSVQNYMDAAKAKNITLLLTVLLKAEVKANGENSEFGVFADEQALMQIFDNLVSNAIKYTPPDKRVFVRLFHEQVLNAQQTIDEFVRIEVQDEGPGLTPQDKEHLFGKFTKLSARPTAGEDSTGLGLSIVKHLSQMMNAQVWCESESGEGAVFILRLPFASSIQLS